MPASLQMSCIDARWNPERTKQRWAAARISDFGLTAGQAVAVQLPNGPDIVTTMMGAWLAGTVFVPINARAPEREVASIVQQDPNVAGFMSAVGGASAPRSCY